MCMHACDQCVCAFIVVCMCTNMCRDAHRLTCIHALTHTCMHTNIHAYLQIHINSHAYMHICLYTFMHTIHTQTQTCILTCAYTQAHIHMHTPNTRTHICSFVVPCLYLNKICLPIFKYCGSGRLTFHYSMKVDIDNTSLNERLCVPINL